MISDLDRAAIERSIAELRTHEWAPLTTEERDLLRRALAPTPPTPADTTSAEAA